MTTFDLVIRNGNVFDGSGAPSQRLDIGIKDGLITTLAANIDTQCDHEIDAAGQMVTPGFVDVHTHYDGQATWDSHMAPSSNLGTTTVVMGNCGVGFAPCRPKDHEVLIQLMEGVEEIPGTALAEGLTWEWETFGDFMDLLDTRQRDIDVAALVPHGPLRVYVMGERGVNRETATEQDIQDMKQLLQESMDSGALGFSTSRTLVHRTSTGQFVPTYKAATDELKQLGEVLSGDSGHVFQLISDWEDPTDEFEILRHTSEKTGAKGTFTLLQLETQPDLWKEHLSNIERAQADGLDIRGQVLSRPLGILMGHPASMSPFYQRPSFTALSELDHQERMAELRKPEVKAKILSEINPEPHIFVKIVSGQYGKMYPLANPIEYMPEPTQCVAKLAEQVGQDPESWLYDYFLENDGQTLIYIPVANYFDDIPELLNHPNTVAALGDGGAHVGSICDTSANIYLLTKWVREKQAIDLAAGIHMLTRQPAELYSLHDRGLICEGMKADINIIDFENLNLHTPHIVHDLPAGGKRFQQRADGISTTIVSGQVIFQDGEATGHLPGKLIRGKQADPRV